MVLLGRLGLGSVLILDVYIIFHT